MTAERFSIDDRLTSVLPSLYEKIRDSAPRSRKGRVRRLLGVIIHATASGARIGELCHLVDPETGRRVMAEVIGILDDVAVLTPIGDLFGLSSMTEVIPTGTELLAPVGDGLLGRVINALGRPDRRRTSSEGHRDPSGHRSTTGAAQSGYHPRSNSARHPCHRRSYHLRARTTRRDFRRSRRRQIHPVGRHRPRHRRGCGRRRAYRRART